MIPKIIWHIWISDKPEPEQFKQYTDTWSRFMPDYKIVYVELKDIPETDFTKRLIQEKKWSVLNHWARYDLLFLRGGIYLDLDVEVVKSFDDLLDKDFIAWEDDKVINNAIMGFHPVSPLIDRCVTEIEDTDLNQDQLELKTGPWLTTKVFKDNMDILPPVYFYPYHYSEKFSPDCIKPETHAIHHWAHSWK